jgi:histidinol dehydrogenase
MTTITSSDFAAYWAANKKNAATDSAVNAAVEDIIARVRTGGDAALRELTERFDHARPASLEVPQETCAGALQTLKENNAALYDALNFAVGNIRAFAKKQREECSYFEVELTPGVFTGQRVLPVERACVYVPAGRFPLVSTVLMTALPALEAGVREVCLASPPRAQTGLPDAGIMAAAALCGVQRVFAVGGAQALAAFAYGTESVPRVDVIVGPGNRYVATAKRLLYGQVGIDLIAGPTDVLVIAGPDADWALVAVDLVAQAEHDPAARARALVPSMDAAQQLEAEIKRGLDATYGKDSARPDEGRFLLVVYDSAESAIAVANTIAPEHLELQVTQPDKWTPRLGNFGSLFIGRNAAEVLGDYSAGVNHTLPTNGCARYTGGLSVRHFLKIATTLRCTAGEGVKAAYHAAAELARAEHLLGHERAAKLRTE